MNWEIESGLRVDLVCYAGRNLSGKRSVVQVFPGGNRKGNVATADLSSMVIRARHGTRIVLITAQGSSWTDLPWRAIRMVEGHTVPSERRLGMPGVRIPDLELLDEPAAKRTNRELEATYPAAEGIGGESWTYGRIGELKGKVVTIRVEHDVTEGTDEAELPEVDALARNVLLGAREAGRSDLPALTSLVAAALGKTLEDRADGAARVEELVTWAEGLED